MNNQPFAKPPRWWSPKSARDGCASGGLCVSENNVVKQRLVDIETTGVEHLQAAVARGDGVLITPNHASHADCFSLYGAADVLGMPFYVMIAWQVFQRSDWLRQLALRHHGCFSIDREGMDMNAIRQAREVLQSGSYPLVIFPEGEVYHVNDRVTPFRDGPAAIALMAAKKAQRRVVCVPCAMKYRYVQDPTPALLALMDQLEQAVYWKPRPDLTLPHRIYHLAEGLLALKEIEFFGRTSSGSLPERIGTLIEFLLARVEVRYDIAGAATTVPERVKAARREIIRRLEEMPADALETEQLISDLDEMFVVVQAYSYPGNYVAQQPSVERMAETLDKFEEDVLGVKTATIRGTRKVSVVFGEPIPVVTAGGARMSVSGLTNLLEQRVQEMLDAQVAATAADATPLAHRAAV